MTRRFLRKRHCHPVAKLWLALALAACSGSPQDDTPQRQTTTTAPASKAARDRQDCAALQPAPAGAPADDVIGLRPGVPMDVAEKFLQCRNPDYKWMRFVETIEIDKTRRIAADVLRARSPDEDFYLRFSGASGQERAIFLERRVLYRGVDQPTLADLKSTVFKKYGEFQSLFRNTEDMEYGEQSRGAIVRRRDGTPIPRSSKAFWTCSNATTVHHEMPIVPECGLTVAYLISFSSPQNSITVYLHDSRVLEQLAAEHEGQKQQARNIEL